MTSLLRLGLAVVFLLLAGCSDKMGPFSEKKALDVPGAAQTELTAAPSKTGALSEEQALDAVWGTLEPNTSSHDRANWEVAEVRRVVGREVAGKFEGDPAPSCPGPAPPANGTIRGSGRYWYVDLKPRLATPVPQEGTVSPTAPPVIPEPFARRALFLLDEAGSRVVARKLYCVIY